MGLLPNRRGSGVCGGGEHLVGRVGPRPIRVPSPNDTHKSWHALHTYAAPRRFTLSSPHKHPLWLFLLLQVVLSFPEILLERWPPLDLSHGLGIGWMSSCTSSSHAVGRAQMSCNGSAHNLNVVSSGMLWSSAIWSPLPSLSHTQRHNPPSLTHTYTHAHVWAHAITNARLNLCMCKSRRPVEVG